MSENYIDIVDLLNEEIFTKDENSEIYFSYSTNGTVHLLTYGELIIWCSEDDDREWIEEKNDYEPLLPYLKKEFNNWVDHLQTLKF